MVSHLPHPAVVIHRVRLGHAHDCAILDFLGTRQSQLLNFKFRQLNQFFIGTGPQVIILEDEYSIPRQVLFGSGTIAGDQFLKF